MRKTSYTVTSSLQYLEDAILDVTKMSDIAFQLKAVDYFLEGDQKVDPDFKITKRSDPKYIRKIAKKNIFLDKERDEKLRRIAEKESCGITTVLFQALYNYCLAMSDMVEPDVINNLISAEQK